MKLIKLKIFEEYRSLKNEFEINFHNNGVSPKLKEFHPFCFAGLNGSGKSNVLEALANIFYHLECCVNDFPKYALDKNLSSPNIYELEYYIADAVEIENVDKLIKVKIEKQFGEGPKMAIDGNPSFYISNEIGKSFLPDLIVAYSSGENETLSLPFVKMKLFQYDQYLKDFVGKNKYDKPRSSLLFIDYEMSQAVLLTALLFYDFEINGLPDVLWPLKEELGIEGMHQFTINLHNSLQRLIGTEDSQIQFQTVSNVEDIEKSNIKFEGRILDHMHEQIQKLRDCATCSYVTDEHLVLDFFVNSDTKELIRKKFDNNPYNFFSTFQMLQALNERVEDFNEKKEIYNSQGFYTDYKRPEYSWFFNFTDYFIIKSDKNSDVSKKVLLKQLSDGEQQFLHTLGICLMLKEKRTLLLLDEPETHFNPDWRSKFINILRKSLETGGDNFLLKDILLTSHSPFILSDCYPDKVIIFKKGEQPSMPDFNTFGTSIGVITSKIFNNNQTIGSFSNDEMHKFEKIFEEKGYYDALQLMNSQIGDSVEKLLFVNNMKNKYKV